MRLLTCLVLCIMRGDSTTDPATEGPTVADHDGEWAKGDVVTYNAKEFVYDGSAWRELGDEASFAVKGSIKGRGHRFRRCNRSVQDCRAGNRSCW